VHQNWFTAYGFVSQLSLGLVHLIATSAASGVRFPQGEEASGVVGLFTEQSRFPVMPTLYSTIKHYSIYRSLTDEI